MTIVLSDWFAYAVIANVSYLTLKLVKESIAHYKIKKELKYGSGKATR